LRFGRRELHNGRAPTAPDYIRNTPNLVSGMGAL